MNDTIFTHGSWPAPLTSSANTVIPKPVSITPGKGIFTIAPAAGIYIEPATYEFSAIDLNIAEQLKSVTRYDFSVFTAEGIPETGDIYQRLAGMRSLTPSFTPTRLSNIGSHLNWL